MGSKRAQDRQEDTIIESIETDEPVPATVITLMGMTDVIPITTHKTSDSSIAAANGAQSQVDKGRTPEPNPMTKKNSFSRSRLQDEEEFFADDEEEMQLESAAVFNDEAGENTAAVSAHDRTMSL